MAENKMRFIDWIKGKEDTKKAGGAKLDYSKVKRSVMLCEWDRKSRECKEALEELGIEDKAPEFEG